MLNMVHFETEVFGPLEIHNTIFDIVDQSLWVYWNYKFTKSSNRHC